MYIQGLWKPESGMAPLSAMARWVSGNKAKSATRTKALIAKSNQKILLNPATPLRMPPKTGPIAWPIILFKALEILRYLRLRSEFIAYLMPELVPIKPPLSLGIAISAITPVLIEIVAEEPAAWTPLRTTSIG